MQKQSFRKWFILMAVGMGVFLATIDGSIVNITLPTMVEKLNTTFPIIQWVVLAYLLTVTTLMLSIGRLGDMIGKKRIYATGFIVFTLGSVLCGIAQSVYWLIGFRVLQAVGAAMIMALGTAIITEAFPASQRGMALGISGSIVSIGIILGPTIGGLILSIASWHWIFLVNLPIGIIGILMVLRFVPATRPPGGQKFDYWGALALFFSLLALLLALTAGQQRGFNDPLILSAILAGLLLLGGFLWIERHTSQPMIDLRLFKNRLFAINLATGFLSFVAIAGTMLLMPFYLENILGYPPQTIGLMLAVVPLAMMFISPVSGFFSDRFGTRLIALIGLVIMASGYYLISKFNLQTTAIIYIFSFAPIGLGFGTFSSPNNSAIMGSAPQNQLGVASGMLAVNRTLGQTTGIALLGAIWTWRVFENIGKTLPEGATSAPAPAQVAGLQQTVLIAMGFIWIAVLLAAWAFIEERQIQQSKLSSRIADKP